MSLATILLAAATSAESLVSFVDPFIGTSGTAHCFPNATTPFGLVQPGPVSGTEAWAYTGGYQFDDKELYGFAQTAISGTGCCDLGDLLGQPFTGAVDKKGAYRYAKADEKCGAGWYAVKYPETGVSTEITATPRVSLYRFDYGKATAGHLLLDLQWGTVNGKGRLFRHVLSSEVEFPDAQTVKIHNRVQQWVKRDWWAVVKFDRPVVAKTVLDRRDPAEKADRYVLDFDLKPGEPLQVKVALSATSAEGAAANLAAEAPGWDFAAGRAAAVAAWEDILSRVQVGGSDEQKKAFYTSMYHLCIQPNCISDVGAKPFYSTFSCWDTFRAAGPLYTILYPERVDAFVNAMLDQRDRTGFMPIWTLWGQDNQCMIGTHSVPMVIDAYLKGFRGFDANRAYEAIKETLVKKHPRAKEQWDLYDQYGYYPFDKLQYKGESVSRTLECCYDDWCMSVFARKLGKAEDAAFFAKRAGYWKNVYDPTSGFMRGRRADGSWRDPFDPFAFGHGAENDNDFTEGNAWQYTWHVMHDPDGLVDAVGGKEKFAKRLDSLFVQSDRVAGASCVVDVTGLIGQYVHGNEPSHHTIYFFQYADRPDLTAKYVREVFDRFYLNKPDGLSGNDDCGQMSAWYIFSAMGFYPFNPCGGDYVLGAPQLPKVQVKVKAKGEGEGEKVFTVLAKNLSKENKYVKSVTLNGKPLKGFILKHEDVMKGGELVFEMTSALRSASTAKFQMSEYAQAYFKAFRIGVERE